MDLELQGRVATITGGGRGIGKAVALALADHGASVGICGRTAETLNATAEEIRAKGVDAWPIVVDVRVLENIQAFISQVAASLIQFLYNGTTYEVSFSPGRQR